MGGGNTLNSQMREVSMKLDASGPHSVDPWPPVAPNCVRIKHVGDLSQAIRFFESIAGRKRIFNEICGEYYARA